jgi:hypothetical protein
MVRKLLVLVAGVAALLVALSSPASGYGTNPDPTPPTSPPPTSSTSSSSGDPAQGTSHNCSLYATSAAYGLSCYHGAARQTVGEILKKDSEDFCWDERISDADLQSKYQYEQNPDAPYYLHSCITGLDRDRPATPGNQPGMVLSQWVIEIAHDATACKGDQPFPADRVSTCIMVLTDNQQTIVDTVDSLSGQIPGVVITTHPSTRVRTNEDVAYTDSAEGGLTKTADKQIGAVRMWAEMDKFSIHPYGPDGTSKTCNGTADVSDTDTPQTKPDACWWAYDASSHDQPDQVYPFRAEADWTVYVDGGAGARVFAQFKKFSDLQLPVSDIQTIVVN